MFDPLSLDRIKRMSSIAIKLLRKPCILMIGPATASQIRQGHNQRNWRMSIFHKNQWWHNGGHIENGTNITRWGNWSPPGKWNVLAFKPDTEAIVRIVFAHAQVEGLVPLFVKPEREPDVFNELLDWATKEAEEICHDDANDATAGTHATEQSHDS